MKKLFIIILLCIITILFASSVNASFVNMIYNNTFQYAGADDWTEYLGGGDECTIETVDGFMGMDLDVTTNNVECYKDIDDYATGIIYTQFNWKVKGFSSTAGRGTLGHSTTDAYVKEDAPCLQNTRYVVPTDNHDYAGEISTGNIYDIRIIWNLDNNSVRFYVNGTLEHSSNSANMDLESFGYQASDQVSKYMINNLYICNVTTMDYTDDCIEEAGGGDGNDSITFVSQSPSDITDTNLIDNILNITYKVNVTNLNTTSPYLNYTITSSLGAWIYVNGSVIANDYQTQFYTSNNSIDYSWVLDENNVYGGRYNILDNVMENTIHDIRSVGNQNSYVKTRFYNITTNANYTILEAYINTSGDCGVYYCNKNYTTGNPTTSAWCVQVAQVTEQGFNHTSNQSKHNRYPIGVINGKINGVTVTDLSYISIRGSEDGVCNYGSVNITTRADTTQTSINNGATYTNRPYTVDMHIHQYNSDDIFKYQACAYNTSQSIICSGFTQDNLNVTKIPPTPVIFSVPNYLGTTTAETTLTVTFTNSTTFGSATITNYNISVLNDDLTLNNTIGLIGVNTSYPITVSGYDDGSYHIRVISIDSLGQKTVSISDKWTKFTSPDTTDAILLNISSQLTSLSNIQNQTNRGINMIALYILAGVLLVTSVIFKNNAYKSLASLYLIVLGFSSVGAPQVSIPVAMVTIFIGIILLFFDVEETKMGYLAE